MVLELFTGHEVKMDYNHTSLRYTDSKLPMQLDIYIPSLNLAFEYQGEQHYASHYLYGSPEIQRKRDLEKSYKCKIANITLVHIPYWWDKEKSSLVATIRKHRPDLLLGEMEGTPIPTSFTIGSI
jgi:hypothetical protein